jgi:hypothetical protein
VRIAAADEFVQAKRFLPVAGMEQSGDKEWKVLLVEAISFGETKETFPSRPAAVRSFVFSIRRRMASALWKARRKPIVAGSASAKETAAVPCAAVAPMIAKTVSIRSAVRSRKFGVTGSNGVALGVGTP